MTNQQPPDIIEIGGVKYQRLPEPKPQTLYEILCVEYDQFINREVICDIVERWLPKEHDTNSDGWNKCVRMLQEKLR